MEKWTTGILYKHPILTELRYPLFELDYPESEDKFIIDTVIASYRIRNLPLLIHTTGITNQGLHFISTKLMNTMYYKFWLNSLRRFNRRCPMTTLRIINNKYENEDWKFTLVDKELVGLSKAIINQDIRYISNLFQTVRYKLPDVEVISV